MHTHHSIPIFNFKKWIYKVDFNQNILEAPLEVRQVQSSSESTIEKSLIMLVVIIVNY